ncbi:MAG TPA: helix-turn-helix domain-containing protein [Dongiaceae bacterium]|nr:helix-turn-helix domain-containing protein [Dongiaceae bacterium]
MAGSARASGPDTRRTAKASASKSLPTFLFVLQPEFPMSALIMASEALRIANQNSGRELFRWRFLSETGAPVRASNGMWMPVDGPLSDQAGGDPGMIYALLFASNLPTQRNSSHFLGLLRGLARFGANLGAFDTGAFALAQAGLVGARDTILHWEANATFRERFPKARIRDQLYLVDDRRMYSAGGVAALDLMLDIIGRLYGGALANEVANALVHTPRAAPTPQRPDSPPASGARRHGSLAERLVALMESNLDFALSLDQLAAKLKTSPRSLIRLSRRHFGVTPMRLYLRIRLQAARNMLFYEEFSIGEVAIACGFSYGSVFSRAFRQQFDQTPQAFRAELRRKQDQTLRPEIRRLAFDRAR